MLSRLILFLYISSFNKQNFKQHLKFLYPRLTDYGKSALFASNPSIKKAEEETKKKIGLFWEIAQHKKKVFKPRQ